MLLHTVMARGVHLGILLICLVQAEDVCCSQALGARGSQGHSSNTYVHFSPQNIGLGGLGGNNPQNELRRASEPSIIFNTEPAVSRGYSYEHSSGGSLPTVSRPAENGLMPVRLVKSGSVSKPSTAVMKSHPANAQTVPKKQSVIAGLSSAIASAGTFSRQSQNDLWNKRARPPQQSRMYPSKYPSSKTSSKKESAAHKLLVGGMPTYDVQKRYSPVRSSALGANPPLQPRKLVPMQTSATAKGRRVSSHRGSKTAHSSNPQTERSSQTGAGKPPHRKTGSVQESSKPSSVSGMTSIHVGYGQSLPVYRRTAQVSLQPHILEKSYGQGLSYKPEPLQASGKGGNPLQGAEDLPGSSPQRFAPSRTYSIPQRFGGYAVRRLGEPSHQEEVRVQKPQPNVTPTQTPSTVPPRRLFTLPSPQPYTRPPRPSVSLKPQGQNAHPVAKWKRFRTSWRLKDMTSLVMTSSDGQS